MHIMPEPVAQGRDPWVFPPGAARDDAAPAMLALLRQVPERVRHLTRRYRAKAARLRARLVLGAEIALVDGAAERVQAALARGQADQAGPAGGMDHVRALQERQHDLVKELQHRTFNLMCLVRSIADMTIRSSRDLGDFDLRFSQRIDALARAQRLLSRSGRDGCVRFGELIRGELLAAPVPDPGDGRATLDGADDIPLRAGMVQLLAMALHELTMDAVRQGGLAGPDGRLRVRWWADTDGQGQGWLHIDWRETGVAPPWRAAGDDDRSEGRTLIEAALPFQLRARTHYVPHPDGLHCSIALPIADGRPSSCATA